MKSITMIPAQQYSTAQVYGSGAEGALVSEKGEQVGPWVTCRDFYTDARRWELFKTGGSIYGYKYKHGVDPLIGSDAARLLITNAEDPELKVRLENIKNFMNEIESSLGISVMSDYAVVSNPPAKYKQCGVSMWTGDKLWVLAPPLFSAWTFLLRNARNYVNGDWRDALVNLSKGKGLKGCSNDNEYAPFILHALEFWVKMGIENCFYPDIKENYPIDMEQDTFHHHTGVCSYAFGDVTVEGWKYPSKGNLQRAYWLHA